MKINYTAFLPVIISILVSACSGNNSNGKSKDKLNDSTNKAYGDTALQSNKPEDKANKYPVKTNFFVNLKPGNNFDTLFYLNENKIKIAFEPEGRSATRLWSVMRLWINSNEINLYDAPHGPGMDQVGLWNIGEVNDFSEIIKTNNDDFPASLNTKILSKAKDQTVRIEVNLNILGETSRADIIHKYKKYIISKGIEDYWEGGYAKIQIVQGGYYSNNKTMDYFLSCFQGGGDYGRTYYHFYNSATDKIYELNLEKALPYYEIFDISGIEPGIIHAKGKVAIYSSEKVWQSDLNIDFKIIDNTNIELNKINLQKYAEAKRKLDAESAADPE